MAGFVNLTSGGDLSPGLIGKTAKPFTARLSAARLRSAEDTFTIGLVDEYQLTTVPIAIGAGRSPFAELDEHLKLTVVEEARFRSGALRSPGAEAMSD
ncbi:MAG: hypothetical protein ACM33U_01210 [Solirubrobacterales bacterium]